jgi:hypothetical protein
MDTQQLAADMEEAKARHRGVCQMVGLQVGTGQGCFQEYLELVDDCILMRL